MRKLNTFCLLLCTLAVLSQTNRNQGPLQLLPQQRTCGTGILPPQFEAWVQSLQASQAAAKGVPGGGGNTESIFNIPVIVHIVHDNEAVNTLTATSGGNLNAAQIVDQINILNRDYNGLNPDTASIPGVFKPYLGKFQVNFCLAVVNPTGGVLAEPGIDRINRVSKGWSAPPYTQAYIDATIKPNSIWDPNRYFNVWVMNLGGGLLGYATFPNPGGTGILGLPAPYGTATTDGVVILNQAFGSIGTAANFTPYNKGRTITHEAGHWMGLRHIWGDASCGNDYCNDTPTQQTSNFGCPAFPKVTCGNGPNGDMFMNFMDYTDDACMFMFTKDQKYRAQLILAGAPIRSSLITSTVCNLPTVGNDIGITYVANPTYSQIINCYNYFTPALNLGNFGSTTLTTATIYYNVDGVNTQTVSWAGSLSPSTTVNYSLPVISNLVNGAHAFNATVTAPNGGADNNANNNVNNQLFSIANSFTLSATTATICAGQSATLIGSGGATSYSWNPGAIAGATAVVSPTATTIYTLTGTTGTCSNTRTTNVTVTAGLALTVNNPSICAGNSAVVTVSGAINYTWSNGPTTASMSASPLVTTVYTVTGVSGSCSGSQTATINVTPNPTVTVNSATICSGNSAVLTASGATTYSWNTGATTASVSVSPVATIVYTVNGYNGVCQGSKTVQVNVNPTPTVTAGNTTICSGATTTLTASGATSYSWSNGALTSSTTVSPAVTTVYTVNGTSGGCTGNKTVTVTVNPTPTVSVNSYTICIGNSATLTASGATSYSWSNGAITNPITVTPSVTTVYTTTGTTAGCSGTITSTVTIGAGLSIIVSPSVQTKCSGSSATISASGANTYTWSNGSNASSIVVTPSASTVYSVTGTSGACSGSNTAIVNITPFATVTINSASVLCFGQSTGTAGINANGGATPYTYSFSTGAVTQTVGSLAAGNYTAMVTTSAGCVSTRTFAISQAAALNLVLSGTNTSCGNCNGSLGYSATGGTPGYNFTVSPGGANSNLCAGIYNVMGTDANGCAMNSSINIAPSSGITTTASSSNASCGGCTDGSASVAVSGGTGPYSYSWSPSGGNAAQANNLSDGCYTVTVTDASNCVSTATTCVGISTATGIKKNVQNGTFKFYPNPTDGKLFIEFTSTSERKIELYDVTGRIIIEQRANDAIAQLNIETLSNGVYYIQIKDPDGNRQFRIIKQ